MTTYNSSYLECFPISDISVNMTLAASTALPWTVPGSNNVTYRANFSINSTTDVFVRNNATAVLPTSNTITSTPNQERINNSGYNRFVRGGDVLSFISAGTPEVGVSLLQLPNAS